MPAPLVVNGAPLTCTMGSAPATFTVPPVPMVLAGGLPVAVIADNKPMLNVASFGECKSLGNPAVAVATAIKKKLDPQPCTPMLAAPWAPGVPLVLVGGKPVVNQSCKLVCSYGGVIAPQAPGQTTVLG